MIFPFKTHGGCSTEYGRKCPNVPRILSQDPVKCKGFVRNQRGIFICAELLTGNITLAQEQLQILQRQARMKGKVNGIADDLAQVGHLHINILGGDQQILFTAQIGQFVQVQ